MMYVREVCEGGHSGMRDEADRRVKGRFERRKTNESNKRLNGGEGEGELEV